MQYNKEKYGRILIPMVTPFAEDQSLDLDKAVELAKFLTSSGRADTLILCGTTGEFATMTFDERAASLDAVMNVVGQNIPLIAGVGCVSTLEHIRLPRNNIEKWFEALKVLDPYLNKP